VKAQSASLTLCSDAGVTPEKGLENSFRLSVRYARSIILYDDNQSAAQDSGFYLEPYL
jgi:hypothetical protein